MTVHMIFEKNPQKKLDTIINIDKEKYEINSLHSCYELICKEIFVVRLSKNQYKSTGQSQFLYVKKKKKKKIL